MFQEYILLTLVKKGNDQKQWMLSMDTYSRSIYIMKTKQFVLFVRDETVFLSKLMCDF